MSYNPITAQELKEKNRPPKTKTSGGFTKSNFWYYTQLKTAKIILL